MRCAVCNFKVEETPALLTGKQVCIKPLFTVYTPTESQAALTVFVSCGCNPCRAQPLGS
jgi:hypothetical protein